MSASRSYIAGVREVLAGLAAVATSLRADPDALTSTSAAELLDVVCEIVAEQHLSQPEPQSDLEKAVAAHIADQERVQVADIARAIFNLGDGPVGTGDQRRVGRALWALGWEPVKDRRGRGYRPSKDASVSRPIQHLNKDAPASALKESITE